jgi:hypothetical protein
MSQTAILEAFKHSWYGQLMTAVPWLFSAFETIHFVGLSLLIGALLFVDLRMLGFFKAVEIRTVLKLVPVAIFGFALNVITGLGFFCNDPAGYWTNPMFKLKLVFIALAGLNAGWFTVVEQRKLLAMADGEGEYLHPSVRLTAALSLFLWFLVILAGRLLPTFQSG